MLGKKTLTLCRTPATLFIVVLILFVPAAASAQQETNDGQSRKAELEVQKLELEVAKLKETHADWPNWLPVLIGFLIGAGGTAASLWVARRGREGALDQATHQKRLDSYPHLIRCTAPLALYFPGRGSSRQTSLDPDECGAMGRQMSRWYFNGGGLLLSAEARDAYFRLARALTNASLANELRVPTFPRDAPHISKEKMHLYRKDLKEQLKAALQPTVEATDGRAAEDNWEFGRPAAQSHNYGRSAEFKDYVFLQQLSSTLRSVLAEDLHSRRRPI